MNTATKVGSYVLGLAVVFGGALGARQAPSGPSVPRPRSHAPWRTQPAERGPRPAPRHPHRHATDTPGGLKVSQDGYTLDPTDRRTQARRAAASDSP